ncbi:MAG: hypothetical protein LBO72_09615 [Helicobacteraceae bacterium]|jgi:hypothetical protein|nr:hypothetical protein [Helicobacteraceae bacterium]
MIKYLGIGAALAILIASIIAVNLKLKNSAQEVEIGDLTARLNQVVAANKQSDETIRKAIEYYESQIADYLVALNDEREAHNETRKLIAQIESRDIDSATSRRMTTPRKTECAITTSGDPILEALNAN